MKGVWVQTEKRLVPAIFTGENRVQWIYTHHDLPNVAKTKFILSNHFDVVDKENIVKSWRPSFRSFAGFWDSLTNTRRPLTQKEKDQLLSISIRPKKKKKRKNWDHIALNVSQKQLSNPNEYKQSTDPKMKEEINHLFAGASLPAKGKVLILDTAKRYTASVLQDHGWPLSSIHIPNPIEHDHFPIQCGGLHVYPYWAHDLIAKGTHRWHAVWLDYCCTWRGNTQCCPRTDVKLLLEQGNPRRLLALTLSTRNHRGGIARRVRGDIERWARKAGRGGITWIERAKAYGTNIIFLMCRFS